MIQQNQFFVITTFTSCIYRDWFKSRFLIYVSFITFSGVAMVANLIQDFVPLFTKGTHIS